MKRIWILLIVIVVAGAVVGIRDGWKALGTTVSKPEVAGLEPAGEEGTDGDPNAPLEAVAERPDEADLAGAAARVGAVEANPAAPLTPALLKARAADVLMQQAIARMDVSTDALREESVERMLRAQEAQAAAGRARAAELGLVLEEGEWISGVTPAGLPAVQGVHNANAAISTALTSARSRPEFATLTGAGMIVGEWDSGIPRTTHVDYAPRLVVRQPDANLNSNDFHATHVAGILVGAGVSHPDARGMAPAASLWYWNGENDVSEMTGVAAATLPEAMGVARLSLSNHSYGPWAGWRFFEGSEIWGYSGPAGTTEDPAFGYYNDRAQAVDQLCRQAPYFLPVWSAGNHRNEVGPLTGQPFLMLATGQTLNYNPAIHPKSDAQNNGFDTLAPDKTTKNALVVGSVTDAVGGGVRDIGLAELSPFSSCGPTDDGRVKPDLVANGSSLLSCGEGGDQQTVSRSGTSMSAPNVTGSALVIQQYAKQELGQMLRNFELKALLLQTADDLGNPGPDYQFGWGLMNTEAALDRLRLKKNHPGAPILESGSLGFVTTWSRQVVCVGEPLRVTLCWNDPAVAPLASNTLNNRAKRLVNDLELRVLDEAGQVVGLPWRLDPDQPAAPATRGMNDVDNVEQVLTEPLTGRYTVQVTRKGALTGFQQNFAVAISGNSLVANTSPVLVASGGGDVLLVRGQRGPFGTIRVGNVGTGVMNYTLSSNAAWLVPQVLSGSSSGETDLILCQLETQSLPEGFHTGVVTVSAGAGMSRQLMVELEVVKQETLDHVLSSGRLDWVAGGSGDAFMAGYSWGTSFVARTGRLLQNQAPTLSTSFAGPGVVELERTFQGGATDSFEVVLDGNVVVTETGPQARSVLTIPVSNSGPHSLLLRYRKGGVNFEFSDSLILHGCRFYRKPDLPDVIPDIYGEGGKVAADLPVFGWLGDDVSSNLGGRELYGATGNEDFSEPELAKIRWSDVPVGNHLVTLTATGRNGMSDTTTFVLRMLPASSFSGPDHPAAFSSYEGSIPWTTVSTPNHDGVDSAQSGTILANQTTDFQVGVKGPAAVSFWVKTSTEAGYDKFEVLDNGNAPPLLTLSGELDWQRHTVLVPYSQDPESLVFRYRKDQSVNAGSDRVWVDEVVVEPVPYITPWLATNPQADQNTPNFFGGQVGKELVYHLRLATSTPITGITVNQLPPGLVLNSALRRVTGTPTAAGKMTSVFTISGAAGSSTWVVDWDIAANLSLVQGGGILHPMISMSSQGAGGWYAVPDDGFLVGSADSTKALRSGVVGEGGISTLAVTIDGPFEMRGNMRNLRSDGDVFSIDSTSPISGGGMLPNSKEGSFAIFCHSPGSHVIHFRYQKNTDGVVEGQDGVWMNLTKLVRLAIYEGPVSWQAFQGQYFRQEMRLTEGEGYFTPPPAAPGSQRLHPLPSGLVAQAGAFPKIIEVAGTPGALGTTVANYLLTPYHSGTITIQVHPALGLVDSLDWLHGANQPVTTGGGRPWFGQGVVNSDGIDAARSGAVADDGESWMDVSVPGDAVLKWRWKVSSEEDGDLLVVLLDGEEIASISGERDWQEMALETGGEAQVVRFVYRKNDVGSDGLDTAWVDRLELVTRPVLTGPVSLGAGLGQAFTAQVSGSGLAGSSFAATGLPPGVVLNPVTGLLSGAATSAGVFTATLTASNDAGSGSIQTVFTITSATTMSAGADTPGVSWGGVRGQPRWFGQQQVTHDGVDAIQSGYPGHGVVLETGLVPARSTTSLELEGPGLLTFWAKVESEWNFDFFRVEVGGVTLIKRSGNDDWRRHSIELQPGTQEVRFIYEKDQSVSYGLDAAWVDEVSFVPGPVPPPPTIQAIRFGGPFFRNVLIDFPTRAGRIYRCEYSLDLKTWATVPLSGSITGTGGLHTFTHLNSSPSVFNTNTGPRLFYRVLETLPDG